MNSHLSRLQQHTYKRIQLFKSFTAAISEIVTDIDDTNPSLISALQKVIGYICPKKWGKITATEVTQAMGNNYQLGALSKLPNRKVVKNTRSILVEIRT